MDFNTFMAYVIYPFELACWILCFWLFIRVVSLVDAITRYFNVRSEVIRNSSTGPARS
jgi:hypothetical protein